MGGAIITTQAGISFGHSFTLLSIFYQLVHKEKSQMGDRLLITVC